MATAIRWTCAALIAALGVTTIAPAQAPATDRVADALAHKDAPARLRAAGVTILPAMLDALARGPAGDEARRRLLDGFAAFEPKAVLAAVKPSLSDRHPTATRVAAMQAIAASPTADALTSLYAACARNAGFSITHEFERAVAAIFRAAPDAVHTTTRGWRHVPPHLRGNVLHALGDAATRPGLDWLAEQLWYQTKHEPIVLAGIARLAPLAREEQAAEIAGQLRDRLDPAEPNLCQAASLAVAAFRDAESVPQLIALLSAETRGVRENALWALRRITGRSFGSNPAQWQTWFDAETAWLETKAATVFETFEGEDPEAISTGLRELAAHALFRDALTDEIRALLWHEHTEVMTLACSTLAHLGSRRAIAPLIDALDAEDEIRVKAAHEALRALTGCDLPPESDRWRDTLLEADAVPCLLARPNTP